MLCQSSSDNIRVAISIYLVTQYRLLCQTDNADEVNANYVTLSISVSLFVCLFVLHMNYILT